MIKIRRDPELIHSIKQQHFDYFMEEGPQQFGTKRTYFEILKMYAYCSRKKEHRRFFSFLFKKRKDILIGTPDKLEELVKTIETHLFPTLVTDFSNPKHELNKALRTIFNYSSFRDRTIKKWGGYRLVNELKINVCPYCNRQYITTYYNKQGGKSRATLDHFFDQALHPYLAISLFNLIPSCSVCNSSFKGKKTFNSTLNLHPYVDGFGRQANFVLSNKSSGSYEDLIGKTHNFDIDITFDQSINPGLKKRIENNNKVFKIKEIYSENHKDIVTELLQKKVIYDDEYIDYLFNEYDTIFSSREDVIRMVLGNYVSEEDHDKRPLSKFTRDISEDIGIFTF